VRRADHSTRGVPPGVCVCDVCVCVWCVCVCVCLIVCDLETSPNRRPGPDLGCSTKKMNGIFLLRCVTN